MRFHAKNCLRIFVVLSLMVSSVPPFAFAADPEQPTADPASPANDAPPAVAMEEVVVTDAFDKTYTAKSARTATKTNTPLKDIPASIQVIAPQVIIDQAAISLNDTIKNISGATQSSSSNYGFFNNFLLRGLSVNFLRDGLPDGPMTNGYARTTTNVDHMEVLKGPGSALYGSLSPGGSINLVTKQPLETPAYSISQMVGSFTTYRTAADFGGPIGGVPYRFNAAYYSADGFRDLANTTQEFLPAIVWKVNPNNTLAIDLDYRKIEAVADTNGIPFQGTRLLSVDRENKYYTPFADTDQKIFRGSLRHEARVNDNFTLHNNFAALQRDLFLTRNAGGTVAAGSSVMTGRNLRKQSDDATDLVYQFEPVWNAETSFIKHTLLAGFEYQLHTFDSRRDTAPLPNITNVFNPVIPETSATTLTTLTYANNFNRRFDAPQYGYYLQDQMDLSEMWKARMGGRIDQFMSKNFDKNTSITTSRVDTRFSPQAGLVFAPWKSQSFYGGYSRSHFAIVTTESITLGPPESATQYEVGSRSDLFGGLLNLNLALYNVVREDFLVTINSLPVPVGEQRTRGVEVDLTGHPIQGLNLIGTYALADAELTKLPNDPLSVGKHPTGIPKHTASAWSVYEIQSGLFRGFGLGGGLTYKDAVFIDNRNTLQIPSFVTGDAVFFYRQPAWEVQLNWMNVADAHYFRNGVNTGALPGDPSAIQGTVRVKF